MRLNIKSIAGYKQHHRAGFTFPAEGREVIVDPAATKDEGEPSGTGRITLTPKTYDYLKQVAGSRLLIEPLDVTSGADAAAKIGQLEDALAATKAELAAKDKRIADLLGELEAKKAILAKLTEGDAKAPAEGEPADKKAKK